MVKHNRICVRSCDQNRRGLLFPVPKEGYPGSKTHPDTLCEVEKTISAVLERKPRRHIHVRVMDIGN